MEQEHNHGGDATYAAYAQGCLHPDCLVAFNEHKLLLAQRKLNGEYVDLRRRENQLRNVVQQFGALLRPVVSPAANSGPEPVVNEPAALPAGNDNPEEVASVSVDSGATIGQTRLSNSERLLALVISLADARGNHPNDVLSAPIMAKALGIRETEAQAAIQELWNSKRLTMGVGGPKLARA